MDLLLDNFTYTETGILDETHVRFFTHKSIVRFFTESGYEISKVAPVVRDISDSGREHGENRKKIPIAVRRFILQDLHSYVYQYVMSVSSSSKDTDQLLADNRAHMEIHRSMISGILRRSKLLRLEQKLFPKPSARYRVLQKLVKALKSG